MLPRPLRENDQYVVGLGASAGGLEALLSFFAAMPPDSGLIFVVVQHLSPDRRSILDQLLGGRTAMPVVPAENGMIAKPDHVYLQPPKTSMHLFKGRLLIDSLAGQPGLHLPIDHFFCSLAEDRKERAVGIVLSGTGSDGSRGVASVKKAGGMVMVQEPTDAKFDGMPASAIATGFADYVCPAADMPARIREYVQHPRLSRKADEVSADEQADLAKILVLLRTQTNVDFTLYKPVTVIRRINRRMAVARCPSLRDYVELLRFQPAEAQLLFRDLLIGVTRFFRDRREFAFLRQEIMPLLFASAAEQSEIRVWDAGCSTGEEAYTIAMLLHDFAVRQQSEKAIKVFATDLDQAAIQRAARGFYPEGIAADLPPDLLERYFSKAENGFQVRRHIRELVIFSQQNLLCDPPFARLDFIACRNLLIYLQPEMQREVLHLFHFALKEGGFLFLGNSESVLDLTDSFAMLDKQIRMYRHVGKGSLPPSRRLRPAGTASQTAAEAAAKRQCDPNCKLEAQEAYYHQIIGRLAAACLIVNSSGEVIETFGRTDLMLKPRPGKMNLSLKTMLRPALLLPVVAAMRECQRAEAGEVLYDSLQISEDEDARCPFRAVRFNDDDAVFPGSILLALERLPVRREAEATDAASGLRLLDLEREVRFTRESLQAANEALQTSNEKLLATNEELLAANEELQRTNEELNSVNEELSTVNTEYQAKIVEQTELYNDLDNLFRSTDIGLIFIDSQLRIRKYTPSAVRAISLLEQDLGRKISDMAAPLLGDIEAEFRSLLFSRRKKEKVVQHSDSSWYLVQFIPYIDETNEVSGMVVSLIDVSEQKRAEDALRQSSEILEQILAASPAPTMMVSSEGRVRFVNEMAAALFGRPGKELLNLPLSSDQFAFTDLEGGSFPDPAEFIRTVIVQTQKRESLVIRLKGQGGGQEYFLSIHANVLAAKDSRLNGAVLTFTEVARHS